MKNDIKLIKTELETRSLENWLKVNNNIRYEDNVKLPQGQAKINYLAIEDN